MALFYIKDSYTNLEDLSSLTYSFRLPSEHIIINIQKSLNKKIVKLTNAALKIFVKYSKSNLYILSYWNS